MRTPFPLLTCFLWTAAVVLDGSYASEEDGGGRQTELGSSVHAMLQQARKPAQPEESPAVTPPWRQQASSPNGRYHEIYPVAEGETLIGIAQQLGLSIEELADFNLVPRRYCLALGESFAQIALRYETALRPISEAEKVTPERSTPRLGRSGL